MDAARPLRDVFADLAQDADAHSALDVLRASGHPDLPDGLVAEAVGSYADTAPIEVAEHLSTYVMAHSPVPLPDLPEMDQSGWLEAMSTAPIVDDTMPLDPADGLDGAGPGDGLDGVGLSDGLDGAGLGDTLHPIGDHDILEQDSHDGPDHNGLGHSGLGDNGPGHNGLGHETAFDFGHGTDGFADPGLAFADGDASGHTGPRDTSTLDASTLDTGHLDTGHLHAGALDAGEPVPGAHDNPGLDHGFPHGFEHGHLEVGHLDVDPTGLDDDGPDDGDAPDHHLL